MVESQGGEISSVKSESKPSGTEKAEGNGVIKRLDALIRIALEAQYEKKKLSNEADAARVLKSVGLGPTDIARLLGKKRRQDVAKYLYSRKTTR